MVDGCEEDTGHGHIKMTVGHNIPCEPKIDEIRRVTIKILLIPLSNYLHPNPTTKSSPPY
jgi:hypothetical protein